MSNIHLGASGILIEDGKVLLGLREKNDKSLPGMWCTPGGGVELFESISAAIQREFMEEVGLHVSVGSRVHVGESFKPKENKHTVLVFNRVYCVGKRRMPEAGDGFDEVRWFDPEMLAHFRNEVTSLTYSAIFQIWTLPLRDFLK